MARDCFKRSRDLLRKFVAFSTSTLAGTTVDMLVLWICSHYIFKGYVLEYILSPFISFEFSVLANFCLAYFVIWRERITAYTRCSFFKHLGAYNLSSFGVFLLKLWVLQIFHFIFPGLDVLLCNLLALCVSVCVNFSLNEWVIFRNGHGEKTFEDDEL